jgi:hypothetical protein
MCGCPGFFLCVFGVALLLLFAAKALLAAGLCWLLPTGGENRRGEHALATYFTCHGSGVGFSFFCICTQKKEENGGKSLKVLFPTPHHRGDNSAT